MVSLECGAGTLFIPAGSRHAYGPRPIRSFHFPHPCATSIKAQVTQVSAEQWQSPHSSAPPPRSPVSSASTTFAATRK